MTLRLVIIMEGGLLQDIFVDAPTDIEIRKVDFDAKEFANEDDDRVALIDGELAWITGYDPSVDVEYVDRVWRAWD